MFGDPEYVLRGSRTGCVVSQLSRSAGPA